MEQRLGPKIEAGGRAVADAVRERANQNISAATRELSEIAKGQRQPYQGNIRQFLTNNPEAIKRLSPADVQRLKERYGARFIDQYLQQ